MQDPNTANQGDLIFKLDQDRERKISKLIISVKENNVDIWL